MPFTKRTGIKIKHGTPKHPFYTVESVLIFPASLPSRPTYLTPNENGRSEIHHTIPDNNLPPSPHFLRWWSLLLGRGRSRSTPR